jgi:hypothetical protein
VLAGTGREDNRNTVLLASRDWKYLALLSRRAGGANPSIYLIDTVSDSLSTIDEGKADFDLTGWVDDNFVYTVTRENIQLWQPNRQSIKNFNAPTKKLTVLETTRASGTTEVNYIRESVDNVYGYNSQVYYVKNWDAGYSVADHIMQTKQATFNAVKPDGSAKRSIHSFTPSTSIESNGYSTLDAQVEKPDKIDLRYFDGLKDTFYVYADGQVKNAPGQSVSDFYDTDYPTYLQSPSGNETFWSESRDGKNTLFLGNGDGENGKQIASLSDYKTYGWYTDNYLLVSKNSSELYMLAKSGKQAAVKISDYHKPDQSFYGYGGGYGGL